MIQKLSDLESHPATHELMLRNRAMEATSDGIIIANAHLDDIPITYVNTASEHITGCQKEDLLGQPLVSLWEQSPDKNTVKKIQEAINNITEYSATLQNCYQDGSRYWVELTLSPLKSDNKMMYFVVIQKDVTEQEEAKQKLEAALIQLQVMNTQKDQFLGMAAHDLRGPINNIGAAAHIMAEYDFTSEEQQDLLDMIRNASQKMLGLIDDLLDIAAIESGKLDLKPVKVNVPLFIERVWQMNSRFGEKKGIHLAVELDDAIETVIFDPQRIEQVLDNLISNAFKFSYSDTIVTLRVQPEDDMLRFVVQDEGQGIKAEELCRLFRSFQKTSTRPTGDEPSSGLGLSICKRIVEAHSGTITADSVYGEGSTFSFMLPM